MSAPRTPAPIALKEHLARYLAGLSPEGARVSRERRREIFAKLTNGKPELHAELSGIIRRVGCADLTPVPPLPVGCAMRTNRRPMVRTAHPTERDRERVRRTAAK